MFVVVSFFSIPNLLLTYSVPQEYKNINIHDAVFVPLKSKKHWAIIKEIINKTPTFKTKPILGIINFNQSFHTFITTITDHYLLDSSDSLYERSINILRPAKPKKNKTLTINPIQQNKKLNITLSDEQNKAYNEILQYMAEYKQKPILLHGVTGSGKTFVLVSLIKKILQENKSVVYLMPDITLAEHMITLFCKYFQDIPIISLHSKSKSYKSILYEVYKNNSAAIIVGVHIPVFIPLNNIGLYVVDEEHDSGYFEKTSPFINSKELACARAFIENTPIVLVSATPSMKSLYYAEEKKYHYLKLTKRYFKTLLPIISRVELTQKTCYKNYFWLTSLLIENIQKTLDKKKQVMLFLNRKGLYNFMQCNSCKHIPLCGNCSTYYTVYENNILKCHKCLTTIPAFNSCPSCNSPGHMRSYKGIGVQLLTKHIQEIFPNARITSVDVDILKDKKTWHMIVEKMNNYEIDILIGTQLIARGYHFPLVEMVGIIWGDMLLSLPIPGITEKIVQNIIQVAGRAGREHEQGHVVIQMISHTQSLEYITEDTYDAFYQQEIAIARDFLLYPVCKISMLLFKSQSEDDAWNNAHKTYNLIDHYIQNNKIQEVVIYAPQKSMNYKINKTYYIEVAIKSSTYSLLKRILNESFKNIDEETTYKKSFIFIPHIV